MCSSSLTWICLFWMLLLWGGLAFGQDLADLAEREKIRRNQSAGGKARICIEYLATESPQTGSNAIRQKDGSFPTGPGVQKGSNGGDHARKQGSNRRAVLSRRGPLLIGKIRTERSNLERLERAIDEARRNYPPALRRGVLTEDNRLRALVKEQEKSQLRLVALGKELHELEEEIRQAGWPPGLLRGQLP